MIRHYCDRCKKETAIRPQTFTSDRGYSSSKSTDYDLCATCSITLRELIEDFMKRTLREEGNNGFL